MFNTKKINELTEQLHQLATQHIALKDRFNTYLEKTKPEPKFKMFDEVTASSYMGYGLGLNKRTITGKITKIEYDINLLAYKYTMSQQCGNGKTFYENALNLAEPEKYIQVIVTGTTTTNPFDIGCKCPSTKQSKKKSTKAKRK